MSNITASVVSQTISATVSASGGISANVGSSTVTASASGGVGPQGPPGTAGSAIQLGDITDIALSSVTTGDVLQYTSAKWRNVNQTQLTDGGNF